jgi:hypothetical protein
MVTFVGVIAGISVVVFSLYFLIQALFSQAGVSGVWKGHQTVWGLVVVIFGILVAAAIVIVGFQDLMRLSDAQIVKWARDIYNSVFSGSAPSLLP